MIYSFSNFQIGSTKLLILVTMLYIRSPWLIYYWKFVPFDLLYPFCLFPPPYLSNHQSVLFIDEFFFLMPHISEIIQCFSLIYFTQHNTVNVIHVVAHGRIFFLWLNKFPVHIYIHHTFYLFTPWWTPRWFHILAIVNEYCVVDGVFIHFWIIVFTFWINIQKWNYWVIW